MDEKRDYRSADPGPISYSDNLNFLAVTYQKGKHTNMIDGIIVDSNAGMKNTIARTTNANCDVQPP